MSNRTTDRECLAALLAVVVAQRQHGIDMGIVLPPATTKDGRELRERAASLGVPVRGYVDDGLRLGLEKRGGCYGGGVRPYQCSPGKTGHDRIEWWTVSAGLGPGALPRAAFCAVAWGVAAALASVAPEPEAEPDDDEPDMMGPNDAERSHYQAQAQRHK